MYLTSRDTPFRGGHDSAGVTEPPAHWFFAEGATGRFFDTFLLLANPGAADGARHRVVSAAGRRARPW